MLEESPTVVWEPAGASEVAYLPQFDLVLRPVAQGWLWRVCEAEDGRIVAEGKAGDYEVAKATVVKTGELLSR